MAEQQNVLIKILADVAGANASFGKLQKTLADLSGGTITLAKNMNAFEQGVRGSIGAQKAAEQVSKAYLQTMRQRLNISRAEAAGIKAIAEMHRAEAAAINAKIALRKAELAGDQVILREMQQELQLRRLSIQEIELENRARRALTASAQSSTAATKTTTGAVQQSSAAMGSASFALLSFSQGIQDSAQFSMGFAQGVRAINNNVQQFATAVALGSVQAGGFLKLVRSMGASLTGAGGVILGLSIVTSLFEIFANKAQKAEKATKKAKESFDGLFSVIDAGQDVTLTTVEQVDSLIEAYGNLSPKTLGRSKDDIAENIKSLQELRQQIILNNAVTREQIEARGIDGLLLDKLIAKNQQLRDVFNQLREPRSREREDAIERNLILNEQIDILREREKLEGQLFINSMQSVGEAGESFRQMRQELDLMRDTVVAGFSDPAQFATEYEIFSARLSKIGSEISRSEFAKLFRDGEEEEFFSEEYKDFITERVERTINNMERLNEIANRFGEGAAPRGLQSKVAQRVEEIQRSSTLVGRMQGAQGIQPEELRQLSPEAQAEVDAIGQQIEDQNRQGTDSWMAHWSRRTEATIQSAQIMQQAIGSIGSTFMQLAQTGDKSNKRLFEIGKKLAIAQALISTYVGFTKALEQGGVLGIATGASVLAAGMAKVAAIKATKMGGGGSGGGSAARPNFTMPNPLTSPASFSSQGMFPATSNAPSFSGRFVASGRDLVAVVSAETDARQELGFTRNLVIGG